VKFGFIRGCLFLNSITAARQASGPKLEQLYKFSAIPPLSKKQALQSAGGVVKSVRPQQSTAPQNSICMHSDNPTPKYCPHCTQRLADASLRYCPQDNALLSLDDPYNLVGQTLIGKYRIEALVGIGGMGAVYGAYHLNLNRRVAFKIFQPNLAVKNPGALQLFEQEGQMAARLVHENIVTTYDAGRATDNIAYIAMEWLEGVTLEDDLEKCGTLDPERTAKLLQQICGALDEAHNNRIIHRDLKPANVMLVTRRDGQEQVKVLDFGIGKVLDSTAGAQVSRVMGTPSYASPEQFQVGVMIDQRSDIYSLGVVLFELLTGHLPFTGVTWTELMNHHLRTPPPSLRRYRPELPAAIEQLVRRMLAKQPAQRPQQIREVSELFTCALQSGDAAVIARQPQPQSQPRPPKPSPPASTASVSALIADDEETKIRFVPPASVSSPVRTRKPVIIGAIVTVALLALLGSWLISHRTSSGGAASLSSFTENLGNNVKLEMVALPGGSFTMGSNDHDDEKPPHQITLSPFSIGRYEVTQAQYQAVMGNDPSRFTGNDRPVEHVSWNDAVEFCQKVSNKTGRTYRLPTEAEWEYACRAGSTTQYSFGDDSDQLDQYACYIKNAVSFRTNPVGEKKPNAFGLYDMHGNVWEWCQDWYDQNYYQQSPRNDPPGPAAGTSRVLRGGSWNYVDILCRSAGRLNVEPDTRSVNNGFRVVAVTRTP
jgi:eukaryotic-like serine/threonine-protein kinase